MSLFFDIIVLRPNSFVRILYSHFFNSVICCICLDMLQLSLFLLLSYHIQVWSHYSLAVTFIPISTCAFTLLTGQVWNGFKWVQASDLFLVFWQSYRTYTNTFYFINCSPFYIIVKASSSFLNNEHRKWDFTSG